MNNEKTFFQKITLWNKERNLLEKGFNHKKEISFIVEELLESTGKFDSENARETALNISEQILPENSQDEISKETIIDAFADIIVYATGAIAKNGYDADLVMNEVYKEINSRTGKIIDGKFVKDKDVVPYKASFEKCKTKTEESFKKK